VFFSLKEVGSGTLAVVKVMNKTAKIRLDLVGRRSYRGGVLILGSSAPVCLTVPGAGSLRYTVSRRGVLREENCCAPLRAKEDRSAPQDRRAIQRL